MTRCSGKVEPATSVPRFMDIPRSLFGSWSTVAARQVLLLVPLDPIGIRLVALELRHFEGCASSRDRQLLTLDQRPLPPRAETPERPVRDPDEHRAVGIHRHGGAAIPTDDR